MKYRKKPVVVDAHQWFKNGDHPGDATRTIVDGAISFLSEGLVVRYFRRPDVNGIDRCRKCRFAMIQHGWIDTFEGGRIVCPGDFIITGIAGEHYPCKPDIFEQTYEPVTEQKTADQICAHCLHPIKFRNLSGYCDHLYYPDYCETCTRRAAEKRR